VDEADDFEYRLAPLPDSKPAAGPAGDPSATDFLFRELQRVGGVEKPTKLAPRAVETPASPLATRATVLQDSRTSTPGRRFLYLVFAATLIPLAISTFSEPDDVEERLLRTMESVTETAVQQVSSEEELFALFPDERIEGAHLPRSTNAHWGFAALAAAAYLGAVILIFDLGRAKWWQLLAVAASTATVGILFLLMVQWIAAFTGGWLISRNPLILIVYYAFKFIGFSYNCALDPNTGFWLSFSVSRSVSGCWKNSPRRCRSCSCSAAIWTSIGAVRQCGALPAASGSAWPRESSIRPTSTTGLRLATSTWCGLCRALDFMPFGRQPLP
jgi:hypothetical protein